MASSDNKKNKPSYPELHDIPRVSLSEARRQIMLSMKYGQRRGCFVLVGDSGMGKTQIFHQIAKETEYNVMPIHTSQFGLMGSGIPTKTEDDFFKIALPDVFPKKDEKAIVLFDELNRGLKHAIAMFFTMLEDGRMFNYELPTDSLVCGAMNPSTAAYAVTQIENEAAMRRRIKFLWVVPEFKDWVKHASSDAFHAFSHSTIAQNKPCHPGVLSYFRAKPKNLYDHKALEAGKQYCCPAVVETLSEDVYHVEKEGISMDDEFVMNRLAASMGVSMAQELTQHLADNTVTLGADDALYNTKSIKRKIKRLSHSVTGKPEILAELSHNVLKLLFADTPDVSKVGANFVMFCTMLPQDITSNMLQKMAPEAKAVNKKDYLHQLMRELQKSDDWIKIHTGIDDSQNEVQDDVVAD